MAPRNTRFDGSFFAGWTRVGDRWWWLCTKCSNHGSIEASRASWICGECGALVERPPSGPAVRTGNVDLDDAALERVEERLTSCRKAVLELVEDLPSALRAEVLLFLRVDLFVFAAKAQENAALPAPVPVPTDEDYRLIPGSSRPVFISGALAAAGAKIEPLPVMCRCGHVASEHDVRPLCACGHPRLAHYGTVDKVDRRRHRPSGCGRTDCPCNEYAPCGDPVATFCLHRDDFGNACRCSVVVADWNVDGPVDEVEAVRRWPDTRLGGRPPDPEIRMWLCQRGDDRRLLPTSERFPTRESVIERLRQPDVAGDELPPEKGDVDKEPNDV